MRPGTGFLAFPGPEACAPESNVWPWSDLLAAEPRYLDPWEAAVHATSCAAAVFTAWPEWAGMWFDLAMDLAVIAVRKKLEADAHSLSSRDLLSTAMPSWASQRCGGSPCWER